MENLEINKETDELLYKKEVERLAVKHATKSKNLRMKPFATFLNWFAHFCQANSFFLAASGACSALWLSMGANGLPFIIFAIVFFIGIEVAVYLSNSIFHKMRLDDSYISPVIYVLLLISFAFSTPTTYYCTPSAVELFTSAPVLIDTAKVNIEHDILTKTDTSYWHSKKVKASNEYLTYFESNKKRDEVTGNWRLSSTLTKIHAAMKSQVDTMQRNLDHALLAANHKRSEALSSALHINEQAKLEYKEWCASFGGILALISVLSMVLLFPARWYYEGWEREYKAELDTILARKEKEAAKEASVAKIQREQVEVSKGEVDSKVLDKEEVKGEGKNMQFVMATAKEGTVIKGEGRKHNRIWGEVDGEMRELLLGDLNRHIKGNEKVKDSTKLPYYESLKYKLINYKD